APRCVGGSGRHLLRRRRPRGQPGGPLWDHRALPQGRQQRSRRPRVRLPARSRPSGHRLRARRKGPGPRGEV
ncbi:MAG: hypothetical protein AVDCRST_MAG02-3805, partial [uncultured Rubrobacteraceae bacterium]